MIRVYLEYCGSNFANANWNGNANNNSATNVNGVRPDLMVYELILCDRVQPTKEGASCP